MEYLADRQDSAKGAGFTRRNLPTGTARTNKKISGTDLPEIIPVETVFAHLFVEGAPGDAQRIGGCLDVA